MALTNHPSNSIFKSSGVAINLFDGMALMVDPGIMITSADTNGVVGQGGNVITCNGAIGGTTAMLLDGSSQLTVGSSGTVSGRSIGIMYSGDELHSVVNNGVIFGGIYGLYFDAKVSIVNNGTILSGGKAQENIAVDNIGDAPTVLTNNGTIAALIANGISIRGSYNEGASDYIVNNGTITGKIQLNDGNDIYIGLKGKLSTTIDSTIDGGGGNDKITGGIGVETMTGGTGSDTFFFKTKPNASAVDHITDFEPRKDDIALSKALFKLDPGQSVASAFQDITAGLDKQGVNKHILYNHDTGRLSYDKDGKGGAAPVHFATLDNDPTISSGDIIMV